MEWLLEWGLLGVLGAILLSAVGLPVPEELSLATAGVLAGRGHALLLVAVVGCYLAVLAADLLIWRIGRQLGSSERLVAMVGQQRFARLSAAYARYGGWLVLMVRPLPGMRVPVYSIAGAAGMSARRFVLFDGLAAAVTVPLYVCAGYWFADDLARLTETLTQSREVVAMIAVVAGVGFGGWLLSQVWGVREDRTPGS
ncbi:MAG: VTT domain-containing protein [Myxococcota bacterium]